MKILLNVIMMGLLETWIIPDKMYGAILHFLSSPSISVVKENAAMWFLL